MSIAAPMPIQIHFDGNVLRLALGKLPATSPDCRGLLHGQGVAAKHLVQGNGRFVIVPGQAAAEASSGFALGSSFRAVGIGKPCAIRLAADDRGRCLVEPS